MNTLDELKGTLAHYHYCVLGTAQVRDAVIRQSLLGLKDWNTILSSFDTFDALITYMKEYFSSVCSYEFNLPDLKEVSWRRLARGLFKSKICFVVEVETERFMTMEKTYIFAGPAVRRAV